MTEVAGEVADGFICHPFTTERYLRDVTLPALERGRAKAGKDLTGLEVSWLGFVVTGISIGGHIGGLIGGMLCALALSRFGRAHAAYGRPGLLGIAGVIAVALLSVAVAYWSVADFV